MAVELTIYTGKIQYRNIDFTFMFDGQDLRLIPPDDKKHEIEMEWLMTPIGNGCYTFGNSLKMDEPFLIGRCNEDGKKMVFLTQVGENISNYNSVLLVKIAAYIVCKYDRELIDRISFSSAEIDCIHPVNKAFKYTMDDTEFRNNGVFSITTLDFDSTTTDKQTFIVDGKEVQVYFGVLRKISTKIGEAPVSLTSAMLFEFEPTSDYAFILRLWRIAREFIRFLCYRKNIFLSIAEIESPYEGGKHENFATLHIVDEKGNPETETLKRGGILSKRIFLGLRVRF